MDEEEQGGKRLGANEIASQWEHLVSSLRVDGIPPRVLRGLLFEVLYYYTRYRDISRNEKTIEFFPIMETQGRVYDFMELRLVKKGKNFKRMPRFIEVKSHRAGTKAIDDLRKEAVELRDNFGVGLAVAFPTGKEYPEKFDDWDFLTLPD
jgi:hypothetical protein